MRIVDPGRMTSVMTL